MPLQLVTAPAVTPISVDEVQEHLRGVPDVDDARLGRLILAAVAATETALRRSLINQSWLYSVDRFPVGDLELPRGSLDSVSSVVYDDGDESEQTLSASVYEVDDRHVPGRVRLADGQSWPTTSGRPNCVRVEFVSGFGAAPQDVPEPIRQSLLLQVEAIYDSRESMLDEKSAQWALIVPYRLGAPRCG